MLSQYGFGPAPAQPAVWFEQLDPPAEYADFSYDCTSLLGPGDYVTGLSICVSPAGTGEIMLSRLGLFPDCYGNPVLATVWITGGVPGRVYVYKLNVTTYLTRVFTILIGQATNVVLAQYPLPPPIYPGFGGVISWP